MKELEIDSVSVLPLDYGKEKSASIIDFMAVQSLNKSGLVTFGDLAMRFESTLMSNLTESDIIVITPDRYDAVLSIKTNERSRRQKNNE